MTLQIAFTPLTQFCGHCLYESSTIRVLRRRCRTKKMRKKKSKKRAVSETPAIRRLGSEVLDVGDTSGIASQSLGVGGQGANWKCFPSPPGQLWQQRPLHSGVFKIWRSIAAERWTAVDM